MSGINNWTSTGIFPLQDHDPDRAVGRRQAMAGGRIEKLSDPDSGVSGEDLETLIAEENGHGTIGDVHPWVFWQTEDPANRAMGSWSQAYAAVVSTSSTGTTAGVGLGMLPIKDRKFTPDDRYIEKEAVIPSCLARPPVGTVLVVLGGTDEDSQQEIAIPIDSRLLAPHTAGPGDGGSIVSDFQPVGEVSVVRSARLQTLTRVVPITREEASLSWNCAPTGVDGLTSGLVWAAMDGGGGPTTGGGSYSGPGDVVPDGGTSARARLAGAAAGGGGGGAGAGAVAGAANSGSDECKGGEFTAKASPGFGSAFMDRAGGGPFHAGHSDDKHRIGTDLDGNPINSGHIATAANIYRNQREDGPFLFEGDYPNPPRFPLKSRVHLTWHDAAQVWRWWAEVPQISPDDPSGGGTGPPTGGGIPTGPSTPGPAGPSTPGPGGGQSGGGQPGGGQPGGGSTGGGGPSTGGGIPGTGPGTGRPGRPGTGIPGTNPGAGGPSTGGPRRPGTGVPGVGGPTTGGPGQPGTGVPGVGPGRGGGVIDPGVQTGREPPFLAPDPPATLLEPIDPPGTPDPLPFTQGRPANLNPYGTRGDAVFVVGERIEYPETGEYEVFNPLATGFASLSFRPQLYVRGEPSLARNPEAPAELFELDERNRPHALKLHAWGAQTDIGWDRQQQPNQSRTRGGVVDGGVMFVPPDYEPEDFFLADFAAEAETDTAPSTKHVVMLTPGVDMALGEPVADRTAMSAKSVTIGRDLTQTEKPLVISQMDGARAPVPVLSAGLNAAGEAIAKAEGAAAFVLPRGAADQRPTAVPGMVRVNSDGVADVLEIYESKSAGWTTVAGGGGGGETNTLGSVGTGTSLVGTKVGATLNVRSVGSGNSILAPSLVSDTVVLTVDETEIVLANLSGAATVAQYPNAVLTNGTRALTADLPAGGFTITGLADPTSDQEAATRAYVLAQVASVGSAGEANTLATPTAAASLVLPKSGTVLNVRGLTSANAALTITEETNDLELTLVTSAIALADLSGTATTAQYPGAVLTNGTRALAANLPAGSNRITALADPVDPQDAATRAFVLASAGEVNTLATPTAAASLVLAKAGSALNVRGVSSASSALTVTTNATDVVLTVVPGAISLSGLSGTATNAQYPNAILRDGSRTMTDDLDMGSNKVSNMADPVEAKDATTKQWVEAAIAAAVSDGGG